LDKGLMTMPKGQTYLPRNAEPILVELHCHCCQQPFFANHRKPCGCGEGGIRDLKYCGNCLKCKQHCICKKPRLVSEYPTAFAVHRSVA